MGISILSFPPSLSKNLVFKGEMINYANFQSVVVFKNQVESYEHFKNLYKISHSKLSSP